MVKQQVVEIENKELKLIVVLLFMLLITIYKLFKSFVNNRLQDSQGGFRASSSSFGSNTSGGIRYAFE